MKIIINLLLLFVFLFTSISCYAEIYREVDSSGHVTFSNKPSVSATTKIIPAKTVEHKQKKWIKPSKRNRTIIRHEDLHNLTDNFDDVILDAWLSGSSDCANNFQRIDFKHKNFLQFFSENSPLVIPIVKRNGKSFDLYYSTKVKYQFDSKQYALLVYRTNSKPRVLYICAKEDVPQDYKDHFDVYSINQEFLAEQSAGGSVEIKDGAKFLLQECRRAFEAKEYDVARSTCALAAANKKNIAANHYLGMLYRFNSGGKLNFKTSYQYTLVAANAGFSPAYTWVGWHYHFAKGVPQNFEKALQWSIASVDAGNLESAKTVASFYMQGKGVKKDYAQAAVWLTIAARAGDAHAQNKLGCMYANGVGVKQDYKLAHEWILKSYYQHNAKATYNLAVLYEHDKVVKNGKGYSIGLYKDAKKRGINKISDIIDIQDRVWLTKL